MAERQPRLEFDTVCTLLSCERRRRVVRTLTASSGPVPADELARKLRSAAPRTGTREEVTTLLHHVDIPKLAEADAIRYDPAAETVSITSRGVRMDRFLRTHGTAPTE